MMPFTFTPQQWEKFARHVQPGCRCRILGYEGIILENWPCARFERWIEISESVREWDLHTRDEDQVLRFQPFDSIEILSEPPLLMRFLIDDQWKSIHAILALPDEM